MNAKLFQSGGHMKWDVYKHHRRGQPSHVAYIGVTKYLDRRWGQHIVAATKTRPDGSWDSFSAWHVALRDYKSPAFDLIVLETHETKKAALAAEARLIKEHGTHERHGGYNTASGGRGGLGGPMRHRGPIAIENARRQAQRRQYREPEVGLSAPLLIKMAAKELGGYSSLARRLDVSLSTCHSWVRRNKLPRWRARQIEALLSETLVKKKVHRERENAVGLVTVHSSPGAGRASAVAHLRGAPGVGFIDFSQTRDGRECLQ